MIGEAHQKRLDELVEKTLEEFKATLPYTTWPDLSWFCKIIKEHNHIVCSELEVICDTENLRFTSTVSRPNYTERYWFGYVPRVDRIESRSFGAHYVPPKSYLNWTEAERVDVNSQENFERYCHRMESALHKYRS